MATDPDDATLFPFPSTRARDPGLQPLAPLERLAQYRILKLLGRGGMGVVYQAEDTQLNRLAALKVMRGDCAADSHAHARFIREAQAAAHLKHDHIVTIYQVGQENGLTFLAMEFLTGKSLEDWLRPDRRATIVETLLINKQIARGLSAAHSAKLIHRDIKPANLWLEAPKGRVKILDFGLARHAGAEYPALTQDGSILGTPAFMAPEQARGDVVDHRCDLFSLGCVMYRMLTGRLPFQGNSTYAVLTAIASETPPSPGSIRTEIPQRLSNLVDQLLAKQPHERPESAQAVLEEIVAIEQQVRQPSSPPRLLDPSPVLASLTKRSSHGRSSRRRKRWIHSLTAMASVGAIVGLAAILAVTPVGKMESEKDVALAAVKELVSPRPERGDAVAAGEELAWFNAASPDDKLEVAAVGSLQPEQEARVAALPKPRSLLPEIKDEVTATAERESVPAVRVDEPGAAEGLGLSQPETPDGLLAANKPRLAPVGNDVDLAAVKESASSQAAMASSRPDEANEEDEMESTLSQLKRPLPPRAEDSKPEAIDLLKRRSLAEWHVTPEHSRHWRVRRGVLQFDGVGKSEMNLATKRNFRNFAFTCEWRIGRGGDSGIMLRSLAQVQIWDHTYGNGAGIGSGGLYNNKTLPNKPSQVADRPLGEWNAMTIAMVGDVVTVDLNGIRVVDGIRMQNWPDPGRALPSQGPIALQAWGTPIEFRGLMIQELPE